MIRRGQNLKGRSVIRGPLQTSGRIASTRDDQEAEVGKRARHTWSRAFAVFSWVRTRQTRRELGKTKNKNNCCLTFYGSPNWSHVVLIVHMWSTLHISAWVTLLKLSRHLVATMHSLTTFVNYTSQHSSAYIHIQSIMMHHTNVIIIYWFWKHSLRHQIQLLLSKVLSSL